MSDISISESGDYFYIMQGESDADCWPQYKEAASPDEEMIIRLCKKVIGLQEQLEQLQKLVDADDLIYLHMLNAENIKTKEQLEQKDKDSKTYHIELNVLRMENSDKNGEIERLEARNEKLERVLEKIVNDDYEPTSGYPKWLAKEALNQLNEVDDE